MAAGEAERQGPETGRKLRALVVEDEPDIRLMLDLFLRNADCEVKSAATAFAALEIIEREAEPFGLIVSDIGLPGMDGYQLAQTLRDMPRYANVPMIAVTGLVEYSDRGRALDAGFNERLTKPINLDLLIKLIKRFSSSTGTPHRDAVMPASNS
jgi:two-component system CheB/CheR fusion protein